MLASRQIRLDVRFIGKVATFMLMMAIPWIAWGNLDLPLDEAALVAGWVSFAVGIVEYYVAAGAYVGDIRRAFATASLNPKRHAPARVDS